MQTAHRFGEGSPSHWSLYPWRLGNPSDHLLYWSLIGITRELRKNTCVVKTPGILRVRITWVCIEPRKLHFPKACRPWNVDSLQDLSPCCLNSPPIRANLSVMQMRRLPVHLKSAREWSRRGHDKPRPSGTVTNIWHHIFSVWASLVTQLVNNPPTMETPVWFLGWKDLLEKG